MSVHRRRIGAESGGMYPQHIGFRWRTCQCRHLPRAFETACGPLGPEGRSLAENTPFGGFRAGLRRPNQLVAAGFSADWLLYSPNLNSLDFSTGRVLQPKGQAKPHTNLAALHASVAAK
jgi:hypothetical protein